MALARRRRASMRILRPLGDEHADCWDVLALPEARDAVERRLAEELRRRSGEWDALVLTHLTHAATVGDTLAGAGLHARGHEGLPHPHVALPESFDAYLARFPSERRRRMRKHLQPLERGRVTADEGARRGSRDRRPAARGDGTGKSRSTARSRPPTCRPPRQRSRTPPATQRPR